MYSFNLFINLYTLIILLYREIIKKNTITDINIFFLLSGLPNELSVFWQQYPWTLGVGLCKIRAYVSEM